MRSGIWLCCLICLCGCGSLIEINYHREAAKFFNSVSSTEVFLDEDNKHLYVKARGDDFAYGPQGEKYDLRKQGEFLYLVDGSSKPLKKLTGRYIFDKLRNLTDIEIKSQSKDDDLYVYSLAAKEGTDDAIKMFVEQLNDKIVKPQQEIITLIRDLVPQQQRGADLKVLIYQYLGTIEKEILATCLDSPESILRTFTILQLYLNIRTQVYAILVSENPTD